MGAHESQYIATPFYWLLCNQMPTSRSFKVILKPTSFLQHVPDFLLWSMSSVPVKQGEKFFQSFQ